MTALEIYQNHILGLKQEKFSVLTKGKKVKNTNELKELLISGEISPEFFFSCVENSQTVTEQMFLSTILKFSSERTENKTKVLFIKILNRLGIN